MSTNHLSRIYESSNFPFLVILNCLKQCLTRSSYQILSEDQTTTGITFYNNESLHQSYLLKTLIHRTLYVESGQLLRYHGSAKNRANLIYFVISVRDYIKILIFVARWELLIFTLICIHSKFELTCKNDVLVNQFMLPLINIHKVRCLFMPL